jgi:hypothetical protein
MATEGQVIGSLIQKAARIKGPSQKVSGVFGTNLLIKDKTNPSTYEILNVQAPKAGRAVVLKGHIIKNFVVPDRKVTIENCGHHIDAIYGALSELKRETKVTEARVAAAPEKNAEQRTIEWLGSETDRLRTLLNDRIDKDREHQKSIKMAVKALREGF